MRRWRWIGIIIVVVVVAAVGIALQMIGQRVPALSSVGTDSCLSSAQTCLRFPMITGDNLLGQSFTLPADFAGKLIMVIVPFDENQQVQAQAWLPSARELAALNPDFRYYNVPVFPSMVAPMRALVRSGMSLSIADTQLRALTITVFLDERDLFLSDLKLANADSLQVFLLDAVGEVLWRGAGEFSSAQGSALRALVAS